MAKETKLTPEQSKLVEDNYRLIYSFLTKYNLPESEWYDLCAIGLVRAAMDYKEDKGAFSTLAYMYMFNNMRNELVQIERHFPENLSIDHEYESYKDGETYTLLDIYGSDIDIEDEVVSNIYVEEMKRFFNENLKKANHRKVIELIFDGKSKEEAAKEVGVSREAIDQAIDRIYLKCVRELDLYHINHGKRRKKIIDRYCIKERR